MRRSHSCRRSTGTAPRISAFGLSARYPLGIGLLLRVRRAGSRRNGEGCRSVQGVGCPACAAPMASRRSLRGWIRSQVERALLPLYSRAAGRDRRVAGPSTRGGGMRRRSRCRLPIGSAAFVSRVSSASPSHRCRELASDAVNSLKAHAGCSTQPTAAPTAPRALVTSLAYRSTSRGPGHRLCNASNADHAVGRPKRHRLFFAGRGFEHCPRRLRISRQGRVAIGVLPSTASSTGAVSTAALAPPTEIPPARRRARQSSTIGRLGRKQPGRARNRSGGWRPNGSGATPAAALMPNNCRWRRQAVGHVMSPPVPPPGLWRALRGSSRLCSSPWQPRAPRGFVRIALVGARQPLHHQPQAAPAQQYFHPLTRWLPAANASLHPQQRTTQQHRI